MRFKKWLIGEARFKGLQRQYRQQNAGAPAYVVNQMYNATISPGMKRVYNQTVQQNKLQQGSPPAEPDPTIAGGAPTPTPQDDYDPEANSVATMMHRRDHLQGVHFPNKKAQLVRINPSNLEEDTLAKLRVVRFGLNPRDDLTRNDTARFNTHSQLAATKGEGKNEPIVLVQTGENMYRIIDGYHRTASYLLQGAPAKDIEALRGMDLSGIDFSKWRPVSLMAFVGQEGAQHPMLPSQQPVRQPMPLPDPEPTLLQMPMSPPREPN